MKGSSARQGASRTLAALAVASLILFPFAQLAKAATPVAGASSEVASVTTSASSATASVTIPGVVLDTQFTPLPRGEQSPWDGEFRLDGIDGLSYNTPGTAVKVRAMSSNAFFVDEVWLVYPRVQYLFNNKDVADTGNEFGSIQFSDWITVGTFPPGTELIFGVKTGVGIDDKCQDRTNADLSVDRHHCYKVTQDPTWVPLAPDPLRACTVTDQDCRNKAWPSTTPDGRTIFYTGPGVRNVKDNSPHGRFQFLTNTKRDGSGTPLTNTALFGLEDVGAPVQKDGTACPGAQDLAGLETTTQVDVSAAAQTVGLSSVAGLAVGKQIKIFQPFQSETVTITAMNTVARTITAIFATPDNKPYPAGTNWAPDGCDWHPDFQDAGIVVWPALAATCQSTTVKNKVEIVGQEGYGSVTLRDSTSATAFAQTFAPGDEIIFTWDTTKPYGVSGSSPSWTINRLQGSALMVIEDPSKAIDDPNRTLDGGICFDQANPPLPVITGIVGTKTCASGWDFVINGVDANSAPPSIRVTWTNDQTPPADEAATIPLTSVGADGVAHYRSDLFTSLRVVAATTTSPTSTWAGSFELTSGPCPATISADVTLACATGLTEWDITISDTTQLQAPPKVVVTWKDGSTADVPLSGSVVGGVAHYRTAAHLDQQMTAATASLQGAWSGRFAVNGVACPDAPPPSDPPSPSPSGTPPIVVRPPTLTDHECISYEWHFVITSVKKTTAPASITVTWANGQTAVVPLEKVSGPTAHYRTTLHLDSQVTNATAYISGSYGNFNLSHGPCTGTSSPKPSISPSPAPSQSTPPSPQPSSPPPTISVRSATLTSHQCVSSEWHFVITSVAKANAPASITVTWANGQTAVVPLEKVSGTTAHYRTTLHLSSAVTGATAVMSGSYGQFNLSHGPCLPSSGGGTTTGGSVTTTAATPAISAPPSSPPPSVSPAPASSGAPKVEIVRNGNTVTVCLPAPIGCKTITLGR